MVDLNFTLVVQLLMFLGFLWLMDHWVLRPLLKTMDMREHDIDDNKEQAQADQSAAEQIENEYAAALATAHQKANKKVANSLRILQDAHNEQRDTLRNAQHEEVARIRRESQAAVETQRGSFTELSHVITDAMMGRLGLGEDA
jgi:F-type H+-transporting ATPase subunit b